MEQNQNRIQERYKEFYDYKNTAGASSSVPPTGFDVYNNLKRLKSLQDSGEMGFFFLAIYSFIEGYLREKYGEIVPGLSFEDDGLPDTQSEYATGLNQVLYYILCKYNEKTKIPQEAAHIYNKLQAFHSFNHAKDNSPCFFISANRVRHTFVNQPYASDIVESLNLLSEFSEVHGFTPCERQLVFDLFTHQLLNKIKLTGEIKVLKDILALKDINKTETIAVIKDKNDSLLKMTFPWRNYCRVLSTLTDDQKKVESIILSPDSSRITGNYLIQGGPGSGKTIILITIFQKLLSKDSSKDIYLLTYTSSLNKYTIHLANHISYAEKPSEMQLLDYRIKTFDEFLKEKAIELLNRDIFIPIPYESKDDDNCTPLIEIIDTLKNKYNLTNYTSKTILNQALEDIWGLLPNRKSYIEQRYSTGEALADSSILSSREALWNLIKELEQILDDDREIPLPLEYACYKIVTDPNLSIDDHVKVQYLLVDEVQDLSSAKISFITKIIKANYILTGDLAQSLFIRKGLGWLAIDELANNGDIGVIEPLKQNFRSNFAIQDIAKTFSNKLATCDLDVYSEGFIPGPIPDYTICPTRDDAIHAIIRRIKSLQGDDDLRNINYKDFYIIAANNKELDIISGKLKEQTIGSENIEKSDNPFDQQNNVKLNTIKHIKGIDCPIIMLLLTKDFIDESENGNLDKDSQMNGIYSSITRAMNSLSIFIVDDEKILKNDTSVKEFLDVLCEKAVKYTIDSTKYQHGTIEKDPYPDKYGKLILFIRNSKGERFFAAQKSNYHIAFSELKAQTKVIFKTIDMPRYLNDGTKKFVKHAVDIQLDK